MANPNKIKLKSKVDLDKEIVAAAVITPGMILERTTADKVQAHSTAGGNCRPIMVAQEDALQGRGIGDNYAADDQVQVWCPMPGEEGYVILKDGESVDEGDYLESAGDGYVQKHVADVAEGGSSAEAVSDTTIYPGQLIARSLEDVNISSSSGVESSGEGTVDATIGYARRIKVEFC